MNSARLSIVVLAALTLTGAVGAAHAQSNGRLTVQESVAARESFTPDSSQWTGQTTRKTLEWDEGNWGVRLDVDQPANREVRQGDVQAGAFYRITPSLRVGGAVSLGDKAVADRRITPAERVAPRASAAIALKF